MTLFLSRLASRGGWRTSVALVLAGGLGALAFPPLCLFPLLALALPFLLMCVDRARNWRMAFFHGFVFGLAMHTVGLYWLTNAILVRAAEFWWLVPFASPGCALILAPFVAIPAALCRLAPQGPWRAIMFAGLWTLLDMGRVFLFTGFPWNPIGSTWAIPGPVGDIMLQPAAWIGVDGLTLVTVLMAVMVPFGRRAWLGIAAVLVLWAGAGFVRLRVVTSLPHLNPAVVLVQGNVPESEKLDDAHSVAIFRRYLALTRQGVAQLGDHSRPISFVWPETAFPGLLEEDEVARIMIAQAGGVGATGMIGTLRRDRSGWHNSLDALDSDGHILASYDKSTLVPFGEYEPSILPFHILPSDGFVPGDGVRSWHLPGAGVVGPLICYEVIFSGRSVRRDDRPDWIVNVTNDGWYGNSAGPRQHLSSARLRAVEEGIPLARAANTGISAIFDGFGHEVARLGWAQEGVLVQNMPSELPLTLFARIGRSGPLFLALLCIVIPVLQRKFARKTTKYNTFQNG